MRSNPAAPRRWRAGPRIRALAAMLAAGVLAGCSGGAPGSNRTALNAEFLNRFLANHAPGNHMGWADPVASPHDTIA